MKILLLPLLAAAAPALAAPSRPAPDEQVSIPFANHARSILTFEAPTDDILYLQDRQRRWYRAELGGSCFGLRWAQAIGYETRGGLSLDRFSSILVDRERCPIVSLTRSEGPPRRHKKKG
ncbi:MAG: hypothetical protein QOG72_924 [Sphingomonadales bacterium]|jgi:hypothetical protein|nr:hypothetical protein [Sphingomonadales bacterium]